MKINNILNYFKIKIIIFFVIDILIWIFSFYYLVLYCIIFSFKKGEFIYQSILSAIEAIPSNALLSLVLTILYKISIKGKYEGLYKFISFLM